MLHLDLCGELRPLQVIFLAIRKTRRSIFATSFPLFALPNLFDFQTFFQFIHLREYNLIVSAFSLAAGVSLYMVQDSLSVDSNNFLNARNFKVVNFRCGWFFGTGTKQ